MMKISFPDSRNARILALVSLANATGRGSFVACSAIYFTRVVGLSLTELGTGLTAAAVCGLFSGVPFGYLADRKGPRETAAALLSLAAVASTGYLFVHSFILFLTSACLISLFQGGGSAARQAALADVIRGNEAVKTRAYLRSIGNVGMGLGTGVAGIALAIDSPSAYLFVMAFNALCLALCPIIIMRLPKTSSRNSRAGSATAPPKLVVLRDHPYSLVTVINMAMMLHFQIIEIALPLWIVHHTRAPISMVAILVLFNTVTVVFFQVKVAHRIDSVLKAVSHWRWSGILLLIACSCFAASSWGTATTAVLALVAAAAVHAYAEMVQSAASSFLSYELAPPDKHGQYQGFFNTGMSFSQMVAPAVLIPLVVDYGAPGWMVLGVMFLATGLIMGPAVRWATQRQESPIAAGV
ncbi:MFS transporter [Streptomyces sp. NPDC001222]|uniref:MFS transporter n=1 Tax=Streptomyces sp. NPDC001222 TaxID=3364548 RepID=UPI0036A4F5F1